jgi:hypothetical protein
MAVAYRKLDRSVICSIIAARGYGFDNRHGFAIALNVKGNKVSKHDKLHVREPIGGVTDQQMDRIEETSVDEAQAAQRVIDVCTGKVTSIELMGQGMQQNQQQVQTRDLSIEDSMRMDKMEKAIENQGKLLETLVHMVQTSQPKPKKDMRRRENRPAREPVEQSA